MERIADLFAMFPLTIDGLGEAAAHLVRGGTWRRDRR
jgi:hypothetical protein